MKYLSFQNGDQIPALGLGTWKSEPGQVRKAVVWAIEAGYRHLDCAKIYQNEKEVGEGIEIAIRSGSVKREDLFVTSKLWNNAHKADQVKPALENTLKDLGLDYLDLYLVHWPLAFKSGVTFAQEREDFYTYEEAPLSATWQAMQEMKELGLARHIGVSNFNQNKLNELASLPGQQPEMNQVEMHPFLPQANLVNYCKSRAILITAYSPLGSPDSRSEKHANDPKLLDNEKIKEIADRHGASVGQVLIAWSIARDIAVIPKSTNRGRIEENFKAAELQLSESDLQELANIGVNHRFVDGSFFTGENSPYNLHDLWDDH
ncbi:aldo/keto reductase [Algoriphagus namhaensis]|uniref:Aldo/keto reductase n=1 Tax=Algoriphagus namhaensis TaxID=915353 RepID=A0ABV8AU37_9BACT